MGDLHMVSLLNSIKENKTLKFLGIAKNNLGEETAVALADLVEENPIL